MYVFMVATDLVINVAEFLICFRIINGAILQNCPLVQPSFKHIGPTLTLNNKL